MIRMTKSNLQRFDTLNDIKKSMGLKPGVA